MMKNLIILFIASLVFASCGKKVSEEEFKQLIAQGNLAEIEKAIPSLDEEAKFSALCNGFLEATYNAKDEIANLLLDNGANVTCKDLSGANALMYAAKNRSIDLAKRIIATDLDAVYERDENGSTTLQYALAYKQPEIALEILNQKGTAVNGASTMFNAPILIASDIGALEAVKKLIEKGAEINIYDAEGLSPLFAAVRKGHTDVVKLLIENGARTTDTYHFDNMDYTLQQWATSSYTERNPEIVELVNSLTE